MFVSLGNQALRVTTHLSCKTLFIGLVLICIGTFSQASGKLESIPDVVEKLQPSVVSVLATKKLAQGKLGIRIPRAPYGSPLHDFFEDFFKQWEGGERQRSIPSRGSGFIIRSDGLIVTNHHVVDGAHGIRVVLHDGRKFDAKLLGQDEKLDLALLKIDTKNQSLPSAKWGDSGKSRVGDWVIAIGNPLGLEGSVSVGVISANKRDVGEGRYDNFIQTDAAINRGSSGGPLFNLDGEVIGISTMVMAEGGTLGIGFAQASNTVAPVIKQLVGYGEVRRGWLGVIIQPLTEKLAEALRLDDDVRGALVSTVIPKGPAEAAGVMRGDVIVTFNGVPVDDHRGLTIMIADAKEGSTVPLVIIREGRAISLDVTLGRLSEGEKMIEAQNDRFSDRRPGSSELDRLGLRLGLLGKDMTTPCGRANIGSSEVVVVNVIPGSEVAEDGIAQGDVILEIEGKQVINLHDFREEFKSLRTAGRENILLLVVGPASRCTPRFVSIDIDDDDFYDND